MTDQKLKWHEWKPGLMGDNLTLGEVMATMPASDAEEVPDVIRHYENPSSPWALPGAVSLDRHDCIHVLLGRGLTVQDEAFVIGVTMGAASDITDGAVQCYEYVSTQLFPKPWQFSSKHLHAFRLGLGFAQSNIPALDLHLIPLETSGYQDCRIDEIRRGLGLNRSVLRSYNAMETLLIPDSRSSRRLGRCPGLSDQALALPTRDELVAA
ncbi:MAG: hypothetical protein AAF530_18475 [Pseudomonadota bacterium]